MKTRHLVWIEAHYALGKLELEQGFPLDWRGRRDFINAYIEEHSNEFPLQEDHSAVTME